MKENPFAFWSALIATITLIIFIFINLSKTDKVLVPKSKSAINIEILFDTSKAMNEIFLNEIKSITAKRIIKSQLNHYYDQDKLGLRFCGGICDTNKWTAPSVPMDLFNKSKIIKAIESVGSGGVSSLLHPLEEALRDFNDLDLFGGENIQNEIICIYTGYEEYQNTEVKRIEEYFDLLRKRGIRLTPHYISYGLNDEQKSSRDSLFSHLKGFNGTIDHTNTSSELELILRKRSDNVFLQQTTSPSIGCYYSEPEDLHRGMREGRGRKIIDNKYGFINSSGKLVVAAIYESAQDYSEGLAAVRRKGKWGYINRYGIIVIPNIFECTVGFCQGLAGVEINGKWGFIDRKGEIKIDAVYERISGYSGGIAWVMWQGKWGAIDKSGRIIIKNVYNGFDSFDKKIALVNLNNKWGIINRYGKVIHKIEYDELTRSPNSKFINSRIDSNWGLINNKGKIIINPCYQKIDGFNEGLASFYFKGKYGYINESGFEVIKPKYENASFFYNGLARVVINGKTGFINKYNKFVIPAIYDEGEDFRWDDLAAIKQSNKWGFINRKGKIIISPQFDKANPFQEGLAKVSKDGKWGYINRYGKYVDKPAI